MITTLEEQKIIYEFMDDIASAIDPSLEEVFGKRMGFFLTVFEFSNENREARYVTNVSNCQRQDIINALREAAEKLENDQLIPPVIGEA